ncbi:MAG: RNA methyltransferase [Dissulfurispiraceae bacterium]|jgi:TrmH family RNA methyltransferase|nr:RNA methyltransferase [Dissulfurispiraceae bacterium]
MNWMSNINFVLVEPREPGNIGASARAIKNMGFSRLRLVNPPDLNDEARWLAHNALDVLKSAEIFSDFRTSIADAGVVIGTTRRSGKKRGHIISLDNAAHQIVSLAETSAVSIVFGREDRGLYNDEVEECGFLINIPASIKQPSLNLSQALLITAYELTRARRISNRAKHCSSALHDQHIFGMTSHAELSFLYDRISIALRSLGYIPRGDRDLEKKIMNNLKHFIGRAGLAEWELNMLHGICTQIEKKTGN